MWFLERKDLFEITEQYKLRLIRLTNPDYGIIWISSGFHELDAVTNGFKPSTLSIVGGVCGMGKTSFVVSLVKKMAIENRNSVLFFSLKLEPEQFMSIILSQQTKIELQKLQMGLLNKNEMKFLHTKMEQLNSVPLEFYDHTFLTVDAIEEILLCRTLDALPQIIVIDSLQQMAYNNKDKVGRILNKKEFVEVTLRLKELAKKFKIPIVLLTAISEHTIKTQNRRPSLTNVQNYAPIANYADLVLLLYRPEYYKMEDWDDDEEKSASGEAEIIIAKNANGILGAVRVKFDGNRNEMDNLKESPN